MDKYDKTRSCPKCAWPETIDKWDYYPIKKEYDKNGVLKSYKTKALVRRKCQNLDCKHIWYELPINNKRSK